MGYPPRVCLIAFSESPSDSTWLENAPTDSSASHHISAWSNPPTLVMRHNTTIHLHHEKEQQPPASTTTLSKGPQHITKTVFLEAGKAYHQQTTTIPPWRRSDSNRRPPACKAGALPLSYAPSGETRSLQLVTIKTTQASAISAQLKPLPRVALDQNPNIHRPR